MPRILIKKNKEKSYFIEDFMSTNMTEKKFKRLQELNPEILGDYEMVPKGEHDFSWWDRTWKHLTPTKIVACEWEVDPWGNGERMY